MKNQLIYFVLLLMLLLGFTSCYDDNSTLASNTLPEVVIDTTGNSALSVFQFEQLTVTPTVNLDGLNKKEVSYQWKINLKPNDTLYNVISHDKNLDVQIALSPNITGEHYQLVYTITDKATQLEYMMAWPLTVKNSIGEGLVIATTDGTNADISHIMSPLVTPDFNKVSVKYNIYSTNNNGEKLAGTIRDMLFTNHARKNVLFVLTDNKLIEVNTFDYTYAAENADLFFGSVPQPPQALYRVSQSDMYIGGGSLTATWMAISKKFGVPFDFEYTVPKYIALNRFLNPNVTICFYDEVEGKFVYLPSVQSFGDNEMHPVPAVTGGAFDPTAIPNKVNLAAGVAINGNFLHLLKDKQTDKIGLYILDAGAYVYPNVIPPAPTDYFDLTNAPDINQAEFFVFMDNQRVLYYATKTKIYAVLYGTATPTYGLRYTAKAGEEITTLDVYQQADYPFGSSFLSTNDNQLVMSTYDGSEGRVYLLPIVNKGVGNIDKANSKVYDGFERVTAITTQK